MQFQAKENKKEIKDILSSTNSVEQHVYMEPGKAPQKIESFATKTNRKLADEENQRDVFKHKRVDIDAKKVGIDGAPNILRTIHMPNDQANSVESETIKLNI